MKKKILTLSALLTLLFSLMALYSCGGDEIEEHEHVFENYVSNGNATCSADGTKTAKCKDCDKIDIVTDDGSKLGHDYVYTYAGDAHNGDCTRCDSKVAEPHSDTEWFSFAIAELNTTAYTRCCPVCLAVEYKFAGSETSYTATEFEAYLKSQSGGTIPETVHIHRNITSIPPKAPTCTEDGFEYRIKCLGCGEIIHEKLLPNLGGHNYELVDHKDATCASAGYDKYECSKCGDEYTTPITVEHNYELTDHKDGSCTEDGYDKYVCSVCNDEKTDIIKIEHELVTESNAPTCTEEGSSYSYCKNCDYENSEVLAVLGHSYTNYIPNNDANCTTDGTKTAKCDRCDETETVIDADSQLGHNYEMPLFTWDGYSSASAQFVCTREASHIETQTAVITSEVTKEATTAEIGTQLYTATVILLGVTYTDTKSEEIPIKAYSREDNYIYFGSYPQSVVNDSGLSSTLTSLAGALPTKYSNNAWTSYSYYISTKKNNSLMWYIDITHEGEKYRGVYFISYRPYFTSYSSTESNTYQDDNGYGTSQVYWFKYEPIKWRILTEENGRALIFCEMIIDSQEFYHLESNRTINSSTVFAHNYEYSNIRAWLNDNFYNTAFNGMQKELIQLTTVDNSVATTGGSLAISYHCKNTNDNVFLLSYKDVMNESYDFTNNEARQKETTDYAQCQGAYTESSGNYVGNGYWWLRSPNDYSSSTACIVNIGGDTFSGSFVYATRNGVCPALWIILE